MQQFDFKLIDDGTYSVVGYRGDEVRVVVPGEYLGKPVTVLFDRVFRHHAEIEAVELPSTVTDIGEFAFGDCSSLRSVVLPAELQSIWQHAFVRSGVEEIVLPEHVRTIAPYAFKGCKNLRRFVCNDCLKAIRAWTFSGCDNLTDFVVGPNTEVSPQAFEPAPL